MAKKGLSFAELNTVPYSHLEAACRANRFGVSVENAKIVGIHCF